MKMTRNDLINVHDYFQDDLTTAENSTGKHSNSWRGRIPLTLIISLIIFYLFSTLVFTVPVTTQQGQPMEHSDPQPVAAPRASVSEPQATPHPFYSPAHDRAVIVPPVPAPRPDQLMSHPW